VQATFLPFRHLPSRGRVALGRSVGRGQGCADVVAGTFFDAPCPKVGAGFQPAHAIPQVENLRPLQATCGHFGRHPRGCRPRSGDCFMCSCDRVFRTRGRMLLGQASFAVRFAEIWWLSPFSFFTRGCPSESSGRPRASPDCRSEVSGCSAASIAGRGAFQHPPWEIATSRGCLPRSSAGMLAPMG